MEHDFFGATYATVKPEVGKLLKPSPNKKKEDLERTWPSRSSEFFNRICSVEQITEKSFKLSYKNKMWHAHYL